MSNACQTSAYQSLARRHDCLALPSADSKDMNTQKGPALTDNNHTCSASETHANLDSALASMIQQSPGYITFHQVVPARLRYGQNHACQSQYTIQAIGKVKPGAALLHLFVRWGLPQQCPLTPALHKLEVGCSIAQGGLLLVLVGQKSRSSVHLHQLHIAAWVAAQWALMVSPKKNMTPY